MNTANETFNQPSKEPTMDFVLTQTPKCLNGEFQFQAVSDAAKEFTAKRMGCSAAIGFSLDRNHLGSAVKAILGENLTIQMQ
jgi:hypothetical protein